MTTPFISGIALARAYYGECVAPLVGAVPHAAALIGFGSDVLGFDTERSTDHGWGPRLQLFVEESAVEPLRELLEGGVPQTFRGWPTRYGWDEVPVSLHIEVATAGAWLRAWVGLDPADGVSTLEWLALPQQTLLEVTAGAVFHDDQGELTRARRTLAWYPDEVWLWLMACQWRRIAQEEAFVGRAAEVGDQLGSRVVAARLVRDLVRLAFLQERRYAPYGKWLGTAFSRLDAAAALGEPLERALDARDQAEREAALGTALQTAAERHNAVGVTREVDPSIRPYHGRPFRVLGADRFVQACLERVDDPGLRALPLVGSFDQLLDSTDATSAGRTFRPLSRLYAAWAGRR